MNYSKKLFLSSIAIGCLLLAGCGQSEGTKEPATKEASVSIKADQKAKKEEIEKTLSEEEIKEVMKKFHQIGEAFNSSVSKIDGVWVDLEGDTNLVFNDFTPKATELASEHYQQKIKDNFKHFYGANGEVGMFPVLSFNARMEIVENQPSLIKVKSFQLGDIYSESGIFLITAVKENEIWVIDNVEFTDEPVVLTEEEITTYKKEMSVTTAEYAGLSTIDGEESFIFYYPEYDSFDGYTVNGGVYKFEVPTESIPDTYKISEEEAIQLVRKELDIENKPDVYVEIEGKNELGDYYIHVYTITTYENGEGHTATWSWFGVNPITGEVYDDMQRTM
ncbi:hypothetical protein [Bacillus timonensis]|uniref:hypothetical protein n=1 Tax=Bacillus timonensis TaxID=1033734 RepID=UPI000289F15F|nr:hypothetical protein [Bacillus timonensis]